MCAWAIVQSGIKSVYFGSFDSNYGALESKLDLRSLANSKLKVYGSIMEEECNQLLNDYFKTMRN
jgi:tRNA(Arg) A34 adenosine deaminase TadA